MKSIVFAALWVVFILVQPLRAGPLIRVAADEWPPFSGDNLPEKGLSLEVIATVLTRAGYDVQVQILPWARVLKSAQTGQIDVVGSLFNDPERAAYLLYSESYYSTPVHFVQKAGSGHVIAAPADIYPLSVAVGEGFLYEAAFDSDPQINRVVVTTTTQGLRMVAGGRVDLTLDSLDVIEYALAGGLSRLGPELEILPEPLARNDLFMAVRQDHPQAGEIVRDFNLVLDEMRGDGSFARLLAKHGS
ncbi:transporter substrate-binding domain-containing protein [Alphaproteobacteria bacterium KMM 3653]|uniref:Transporter substrate-binding domain-containing protein n=1 Tax=Harenicola maris TaxID=2841044 RepID=A0AAP2CT15_9RHOB|nr:transporter substrate-binding domain-containing protein [Harenicola maris]